MMQPFCSCLFLGVLLHGIACFGQIPAAEAFGKTKDGHAVELYTLKNSNGLVANHNAQERRWSSYVPDKNGKADDVVLGFDDVSGYESEDNQYFGCTTGRVCNRIVKGKFSLEGKDYTLAINNEPNHLHGGVDRSLDKVIWSGPKPYANDKGQGVKFQYTSPDGEEGYPGELKIGVDYFVPSEGTTVAISYDATTNKATPVNLTNHTYFNLGGAGSSTVLDHLLRLNAETNTRQRMIR